MKPHFTFYIYGILAILLLSATSCNVTKHIDEGEYLLRSNDVDIEKNGYVTNRDEMTEDMESIIIQQPNTYFLYPWMPYKLWLYNLRYEKYKNNPDNFQLQSGTVEKPVIYDSTTIPASKQYMEAYMFRKGYFYSKIYDTTIFRKKKAYVQYDVDPGINYLIDVVYLTGVEDSTIARAVRESFIRTYLRGGTPYSSSLMEQERSRITTLLRNGGYYHFTNDNIAFVLDTVDKDQFNAIENPFEGAVRSITEEKNKRPTLDIYLNITDNGDPNAFRKYAIHDITVYPDFKNVADANDSDMIVRTIPTDTDFLFRYHDYYVREKVVYNHIYQQPQNFYSLSRHEKTITALNQLGIFETIRIDYLEDTSIKDGTGWLHTIITMTPSKKYDFDVAFNVSSGTTYDFGNNATVSLVNKNLGKGANFLTFSVNGGIELRYDTSANKFTTITTTIGGNISVEFPKFLFPISRDKYSISNNPRTEISGGASVLDRRYFFTLLNLSTRFAYKWNETKTKSWEVVPGFINDINLLDTQGVFKTLLENNQFFQNAYSEAFILGENVNWTYNNSENKLWYQDYSFVKLGFEEAGGLMTGLDAITTNRELQYKQYIKFDTDLRHYIRQRHTTLALRFLGGLGIPYTGGSQTLPYIKQYFAGGPFSMRGWRVRTLGPGSYYDTSGTGTAFGDFIDRTGDIKLETNAEYRFDLFKAFGGAMKFSSALFADAGNIWLFHESPDFPEGEFKFNRLFKDLAINTGLGLRMDIAEIFLIRVDLGMPLKVPGDTDIPTKDINQGWVIEDFDPLYNKWRRNNLIFNFAIGYPF